jgi:Uma2 family endonuclease
VDSHRLGKVFGSDCGYQIFPDEPRKVRFPDGSFVAKGRLEDGRVPKGHMRITPDLAIEVVSPHDSAEEVDIKRVEYLNAGVKLLWIIYPETRSVHIFSLNGAPTVLGLHDELDGEEVVPGFRCLVSTLFEDLTE